MASSADIARETVYESWNAKIPLRISLRNCGVPDHPLPFYATLPRFAYLPLLTHDVLQFFGRSVVEQVKHQLVFRFQGRALPWHIPVGVMYDLLGEGELPWNLEVTFVRTMPSELLPWEDEPDGTLVPIRKTFFHSLKESFYILKGWDGANEITKLDLQTKDALWSSTREANLMDYESILLSSELFMKDQETNTGKIPARIFMQKGRNLLCWKTDVLHLSRPLDPHVSLLEALESCFPLIPWNPQEPVQLQHQSSFGEITSEEETIYRLPPFVTVSSISPDLLTCNLGWLYETMKAPDNFLYITIKPKDLL